MLICTGITFAAVYRGTATQLRAQIDRDIAGEMGEYAHVVKSAGADTPREVAQAAQRYANAQPFTASSTVLFAVIPGGGVATNRPELLSQHAPDDGETRAQQAEENRLSERLLNMGEGYATLPLPDVGDLRVVKQTVRVNGGGSPLLVAVGAGQALAPVSHAQAGVARAFVLAGILALAGALLGAYLIGTRVSRPLREMATVAARVDGGDLHPRIDHGVGDGEEVRVLADAFNHMLDRLTSAFARQREFVADASHELRTPLTVIRGQLEVLAAAASPSASEVRRVHRVVDGEIARITRLVDDLLVLARTDRAESLRIEPIDLPDFLAELWQATESLADRRFSLATVPSGTLRADPDLLARALRNLLANAIDHTESGHGRVSLRVDSAGAGRVVFVVEDDGPGIPVDQRERVFDRFHRVDSARDRRGGGTGLGLAIVAAIAVAHGGHARAGVSAQAGARIELELPGFLPAVRTPAPASRPGVEAILHGRSRQSG